MDVLGYLEIPLIQNMFLSTICACVLCSVIGALVVVNRMVAATGGIAHTTFGGVGFSYFVMSVYMIGWMSPMLGAFLFGSIAAIVMVVCKRVRGLRQDTVIGALWAAGMAAGVIFMSLVDRSAVTPASFETILFGDVLFVNSETLVLMTVVTAAVIALVAYLYRDLQALTFDSSYARLSGMNTFIAEIVLYVMVAVACVMAAKVVGIILAIALLAIPAATANLAAGSLKEMMAVGACSSSIMAVIGLFVALALDLPPGATVVLVIAATFLVALSIRTVEMRRNRVRGPRSDGNSHRW